MNKNASIYSFTSQCLGSVREKQGREWLLLAAARAWAVARGINCARWNLKNQLCTQGKLEGINIVDAPKIKYKRKKFELFFFFSFLSF